ncbi:MAG: hypothetical protein ACI9WU_004471, partial [Myxococcota bacterium]
TTGGDQDPGPAPDDVPEQPVDIMEPDVAADISEEEVGPDVPDVPAVIGCTEPCPISSTCENGQCIKQPSACPNGCLDGQFCNQDGNCTTSNCVLPSTFTDMAQKTDTLVLPDGEHGCDINGDGVVDNKLGVILKLLANTNAQIDLQIAQGEFTWLFEAPGFNSDGDPFLVSAMSGELADPNCSPTAPTANCDYAAWDSAFSWGPDAICPAAFELEVAVNNGTMNNLGEETITITLPFLSGQPLTFDVMKVTLEAQIVGDQTWDATTTAMLCGAVPGPTLKTIIEQMPQYLFDDVGLTKDDAKGLVDTQLDVDVNGDGFADSLSAATQLSTIPGRIIGIF